MERLILGRFFDTVGHKPMIAATYLIAAVGLAVEAALIKGGSLGTWGYILLLCGAFFFASSAASAGYLTVSELFPLETRAMAIALFYAVSTGIGGAVGPLLFGKLLGGNDPTGLAVGYWIAAALMALAAVVELAFGGRCRAAVARGRRRAAVCDMSRGPRIWGPRPTMPWAASPDLDENADTLVALLRERGPMGARELHAAAQARYWGPGAFGDALGHARRQGRVTRIGRRRYAAAP